MSILTPAEEKKETKEIKKYLTVNMFDDECFLLSNWRDGDVVLHFKNVSCQVKKDNPKQVVITAILHETLMGWFACPETDWFKQGKKIKTRRTFTCSFIIDMECGFGCLKDTFECNELLVLVHRDAKSTSVVRAKFTGIKNVLNPICSSAKIISALNFP